MMSFLTKRIFRRKQFLFVIIFVGFLFLVYQIFSVNQLGHELARRNNGFRTNYRQYEKADDIFNFRDKQIPIPLPQDQELEEKNNENLNEIKLQDGKAKETKESKQQAVIIENDSHHKPSILGILPKNERLYLPSATRTFHCISGTGEIPYEQLNDDYCDCDDGSDEPSTNACPTGRFYCTFQKDNFISIVSSHVNDGICDCCDGSDEWKEMILPSHVNLPETVQLQLRIDQVPCRNRCFQ